MRDTSKPNPLVAGFVLFLVVYVCMLFWLGSPEKLIQSDGINYVLVAKNPLDLNGTAVQDFKAIFYARILMPFLVWMLSMGNPEYVVSVIPPLNLLAALASIYFLDKILSLHNLQHKNKILLLYVLNPILVLSSIRGFTDPFLLCFSFGAYYFAQKKNYIYSIPLMALALLSKELAFLVLASLIIQDSKRIKYYVASTIPYFTWVGYLISKLGFHDFLEFLINYRVSTYPSLIAHYFDIQYFIRSPARILSVIYFLLMIATVIFLYIKREKNLLVYSIPFLLLAVFILAPISNIFGLMRLTGLFFTLYIFLGFLVDKTSRILDINPTLLFMLLYSCELFYTIYFINRMWG